MLCQFESDLTHSDGHETLLRTPRGFVISTPSFHRSDRSVASPVTLPILIRFSPCPFLASVLVSAAATSTHPRQLLTTPNPRPRTLSNEFFRGNRLVYPESTVRPDHPDN